MPLVENSAGEFPEPGVKSVEAAAAAVSKIGPNNEISLADLPASAKGAYPISTYTYVIVPLESEKAEELKKFITYAIGRRPVLSGPTSTSRRCRSRSSPPTRRRSRRSAARWRPAPSATQFCGPGATSPTASATRCCEASPASRRRSPSSSSPGSSTRSSTSPGRRSREFGLGFVTTNDWNPVSERFGAAPFLYGTVVTSFDRAPLRGAALDRDLDLPDRAGTAADPAPGRDPGRHAGGDPDRDPRALGDPRPRPVHERHDRAGAAERASASCRSSAATPPPSAT